MSINKGSKSQKLATFSDSNTDNVNKKVSFILHYFNYTI